MILTQQVAFRIQFATGLLAAAKYECIDPTTNRHTILIITLVDI